MHFLEMNKCDAPISNCTMIGISKIFPILGIFSCISFFGSRVNLKALLWRADEVGFSVGSSEKCFVSVAVVCLVLMLVGSLGVVGVVDSVGNPVGYFVIGCGTWLQNALFAHTKNT